MKRSSSRVTAAQIASVLACCMVIAQPASATDDAADLAKKLANPISSLISVPMKLDWDTGVGPANADRSTYLVQPVIPFTLTDDWNVISRTIIPLYIDAESPSGAGSDTTGMGDILQSFFFSPKAPTSGGWIWGVGPALSVPTGDDGLTTDKVSIGPTAVVLKQDSGWTYGLLANHLWSIAGDDDRGQVNQTFVQPFLALTTRTHTTFGLNTESTYNWKSEDWTVPVNLTIAQVLKIGTQPIQLMIGYRNYVDTPDGGPDWGLRFQLTLLFPKWLALPGGLAQCRLSVAAADSDKSLADVPYSGLNFGPVRADSRLRLF